MGLLERGRCIGPNMLEEDGLTGEEALRAQVSALRAELARVRQAAREVLGIAYNTPGAPWYVLDDYKRILGLD